VAPVSTLLVTGAPGAGRTTVAASFAAAAAGYGDRTLLLTADRTGVDALLPPSGSGGVTGLPGLSVAVIDPVAAFREALLSAQERSTTLLTLLGAAPLDPEEVTELPGAEALALLRSLRSTQVLTGPGAPGRDGAAGPGTGADGQRGRRGGVGRGGYGDTGAYGSASDGAQRGRDGDAGAYGSGRDRGASGGHGADGWDLVVVDLPPVREALRLLALPEQLRRYLARLLPADRQAARALRPVLAQLAGVPMPAEWAYDAAERADRELAAVQAVVEDPGTAVAVVVEPGARAEEALRTARTGLALHGHRLAAVVANRLLPTGSADPFLAGLSGSQQQHLKALAADCAEDGVPLLELPHLGRPPQTPAELPLPAPEAAPRTAEPWTVTDHLADEGHYLWTLPLPGADREGLDLVRRGDELVVDANGFRRILPLPSALRRCTVAGAALRNATLHVRFTPDPAVWPQ
jgi:arsenite-transporting ATPase